MLKRREYGVFLWTRIIALKILSTKSTVKKRKELHVQSTSLGAVHMKIVFPLFSRLTGEMHIISPRSYVKCFLGLVRFNFGGILGWKILQETNIQNGWHKLDEKLLSSIFHDHIRTWHSHFMFGRSSESTRDWKTTKNLYNVLSLRISGEKRIREKLKTLYRKKRKETLLVQARKK